MVVPVMGSGTFSVYLLLYVVTRCWCMVPRTAPQSASRTVLQISPTTPFPRHLERRTTSIDTDWSICGSYVSSSESMFESYIMSCNTGDFCNTANNGFSIMGCCADAYLTGSYSPYACVYYTACENSDSVSKSSSLSVSTSGDKYGVLQCTKSSQPDCIEYVYPEVGMSQWTCGYGGETYGLHVKTQDFYPDTSSEDSTSSSSTDSAATTSTTSSTSQSDTMVNPFPPQDPSESHSSTKSGIIGGVVGGVGTAILAVAAFWFWRHRQKRKSKATSVGDSSFKVLGSNVASKLNHSEKSNLPSEPIELPPGLVEAEPSDSAIAHKLSTKSSSIYQPYRSVSAVSQPMSHAAYQGSDISPNHSFNQGSCFPTYNSIGSPDLRPISEIDGNSVSFLRAATPTLPDLPSRGVHPVELEGTVNMSKQSGPVPDWR